MMNLSSRVFAKYALLLPPREFHFEQRHRLAVKARSPPYREGDEAVRKADLQAGTLCLSPQVLNEICP